VVGFEGSLRYLGNYATAQEAAQVADWFVFYTKGAKGLFNVSSCTPADWRLRNLHITADSPPSAAWQAAVRCL
jgi:hypothetical protein